MNRLRIKTHRHRMKEMMSGNLKEMRRAEFESQKETGRMMPGDLAGMADGMQEGPVEIIRA